MVLRKLQKKLDKGPDGFWSEDDDQGSSSSGSEGGKGKGGMGGQEQGGKGSGSASSGSLAAAQDRPRGVIADSPFAAGGTLQPAPKKVARGEVGVVNNPQFVEHGHTQQQVIE